jgi:hypothetical protein
MSVKVSALCWRVRLPVVDKLVLLRLADYADHDGASIYPAVATVASDCGVSERAVQYILKKFTDDGILILVGNATGGRGKTRRYAMDLERLSALSGTSDETAQTVQTVQNLCALPEQTVQSVCTLSQQTVQSNCTLPMLRHEAQRVQDDAEKGAVDLHPTRQESVKESKKESPPTPPPGGVKDRIDPIVGIPSRDLFVDPDQQAGPTKATGKRGRRTQSKERYSDEIENAWLDFRDVYPRANNPHSWTPAKKLFVTQIKSGLDPEIMISAAEKYGWAMKVQGNIGTRNVADARTWLYQERWVGWIDYDPKNVTHLPTRGRPSPQSPRSLVAT